MCIIQKIFLDQLFKIIRFQLFSQIIVNTQFFYMKEWCILIIQPAVHDLQAKHQSFWETSKICLTELKLRTVNSSQQCLFVNSVLHLLLQHLTDDLDETLLIGSIGMFCNNRKNRLIAAAVITTIDIRTDPRIQQSLFDRCPLGTEQSIIQNIKRNILLSVQIVSNRPVAGQIRIVFCTVCTGDRIWNLMFHRFCKRCLLRNRRIHINSVIIA